MLPYQRKLITKENFQRLLCTKNPPNWYSNMRKKILPTWAATFRETHRNHFNEAYDHYLKTQEIKIRGEII